MRQVADAWTRGELAWTSCRRWAASSPAPTHHPGDAPPLPLESYAGTYRDEYSGTARITLENGHLVLRLADLDFTGDLDYWHDDTLRVTWRYRFYGTTYVSFRPDLLGQPETLELARSGLHYERVKGGGGGGEKASR